MTDDNASTPLVIYLRRRPAEPAESVAALDEQRRSLAAWLAAQPAERTILRECIEDEADAVARPALAEAINLCQARNATLVISSTAPIGTGKPFEPRIASVPVMVLPQPSRPIPAVIPLPPRTGDEVVLYVGQQQHGCRPVYLLNPKAVPLTDVTVSLGGIYTAVSPAESVVPFGGSAKVFARLEPRTGQLVETRDVMSEGESVDHVGVCYNENGRLRHGGAYLPRLSAPRHIALTFRPVLDVGSERLVGAPA